MRLLLALVYIAFGMWLFSWLGGWNLHPAFGFVVYIILFFSSETVCNKGFLRRLRGISDEQHIANLLDQRKAVAKEYEVQEVITFEDLNTSCLCHILKIGNSRVICLYGQYLYDFAEITDDPEVNQPRTFPTSKFTLVRKIKNNEILELKVGRNVVDDFFVSNVDLEKIYEFGFELEDGEILENISFKRLKERIVTES